MHACLFFPGTAIAQNRSSTVKITDENGNPLAGASVLVNKT